MEVQRLDEIILKPVVVNGELTLSVSVGVPTDLVVGDVTYPSVKAHRYGFDFSGANAEVVLGDIIAAAAEKSIVLPDPLAE